jgi:hypothetical protein
MKRSKKAGGVTNGWLRRFQTASRLETWVSRPTTSVMAEPRRHRVTDIVMFYLPSAIHPRIPL